MNFFWRSDYFFFDINMNRDFYNVTALTTSHMKQVIDKLGGLKEEDLLKLDQAVYSYLLKRRENQKV